MLLRITVAVVVCVCSKVQPAAAERLAVPRDYGVKLCGREFIRAVIFTCGGSRWRRAQDGDSDPFQRNYYHSDVTQGGDDQPGGWQQNDVRVTKYPHLSPPALGATLADLLAVFGRDAGRPLDPLREFQLSTISEEQRKQTDVGWPKSSSSSSLRKRRNFSLGVAGMCCSQGCTKNDIGRLC
ncbi:Relaxin-3 [Merluccius polli]|uniref:Relaxin-3 n=1 Tax=Merluccius polli TaxID=89951 RepID=A0AA47MAM7_MERPO|nr:Relaxin-3 [Merluccius polli]